MNASDPYINPVITDTIFMIPIPDGTITLEEDIALTDLNLDQFKQRRRSKIEVREAKELEAAEAAAKVKPIKRKMSISEITKIIEDATKITKPARKRRSK